MNTFRVIQFVVLGLVSQLSACSDPEFDASTPQAALEAMEQVVREERPNLLTRYIHIPARDITFSDGVTEASAIDEVLEKAAGMLEQLYRVAMMLRERFPDEVAAETEQLGGTARGRGLIAGNVSRFLTDPFGLVEQHRDRLTAEDLGDGTAAILIDGEPAFGGLGLQMREVDGAWKIEIPVHLLQEYRPETRHEWAVLASLMLSLEHGLDDFEQELESGRILSLTQAGQRAGRLLGESVVVQAILYQSMKDRREATPSPSEQSGSDAPSPVDQ
jgi:hypothetical protein